MADEIQYKLDNVEATAVAPDDIDQTFRSSSIGTEAGAWGSTNHTPGLYFRVGDPRPPVAEG